VSNISGAYLFGVAATAVSLWLAAPSPAVSAETEASARASLDLATALERALAGSPRLEAAASGSRQAAARTLQAGLLPNPELVFEMEDFGGSGSFDGVGESQATVAVEQMVELGGKRAARAHAARAASVVVQGGYAAVRADVIADTQRSFYEVLAAHEREALSVDAVALAGELVSTVSARVRAGSSSRVERTRAEVELAGAEVERARAQHAVEVAKRRLAASWGESEARFDRVVGRLGPGADWAAPTLEALRRRLADNPQLGQSRDEIAHRSARVEVERAGRIPDVTLGLGYRRLSGTDDNALVAGVRVPLPLFDRNQGALLEAERAVDGASAERDALAARLDVELTQAHAALVGAYDEVHALDERILPASQSAFETVRDGYREGRFSYIELLDAERELQDARRRRLSVAFDFRRAAIDIERLTGAPLDVAEPDTAGSTEEKP